MSQVVALNVTLNAVVLKDNWSIVCDNVAQYEGMKTLLQMLGYTFPVDDYYSSDYSTVCVDGFSAGGITQGRNDPPDEFHFHTVVDFLVFHYDAQAEADTNIALLRERLACIDEMLQVA